MIPEHPEANLGMALTSQLLGNPIQALDYYKLAMKSKPVNVNVLRFYGNFLCEQNLLNNNNVLIEDIPSDYLVCQHAEYQKSPNSR